MINKTVRDISIATFVLILVWAAFEVYKSYQIREAPFIREELTKPINTEINQEVLKDLSDRIAY